MKSLCCLLVCCLVLSIEAADTTPPTIMAVNPPAGYATNLTQIAVTFSEPVTGVMEGDLLVNSAPAYKVVFTNGDYVFYFAPPDYGRVRVSFDPGAEILDLASNIFNLTGPGTSWEYNFVDATPPTVMGTTPADGATVRGLTQVEVRFSEPVAGVDVSDLLVNNQPATGLTILAADQYRFEFLPPGSGLVQFAWATNHGIHDLASAPNAFAGGAWSTTLDPAFQLARIRINEFLAANVNSTNGLKDEDGDLQDWVEIFNYGTNTVNLAGYALTDSDNDPGRWLFPATNLASGQYLVVFTSSKDRRPVGSRYLHTNFKLNPDGNYLALFNNESPRVALSEFAPRYPEQRNEYSYGLDSSNNWRYFQSPTPGKVNGNSLISETLPPVHFNVERGFFEAPFTLVLSAADPAVRIRYTTNGTLPSDSNGIDYTNPVRIARTTTLRATSLLTNHLPSSVETHTYLFLGDVIQQTAPKTDVYTNLWGTLPPDYDMDPKVVTNALYSGTIKKDMMAIPTLSIVLKPGDMFDAVNGIYTHTIQDGPYRGPAWTRPCSAELINPDGSGGFQIDCGIRMQGGGSRDQTKEKKHPFALTFKGLYGAGKLHYPWFSDSPVAEFDTIYLRSDYNNHWSHINDAAQRWKGTLVRDQFFKDVMANMGALSSHTTYVHLYINGLYWGVYSPTERQDASFTAAYFGGDKSEYDAVNGTGGSVVDGDIHDAAGNVTGATARNTLLSLANGNLADPALYNQFGQWLDIPQYIDYLILQYYGGNLDWGTTKNWYAYHHRIPGSGWEYVAWDSERTLEDPNGLPMGVSSVSALNSVSPDNLQAKLVVNAEYRLAFADHVRKHFFNGGALTTNALISTWKARAAQVDRAIVGESARWGDLAAKPAISPLPYPSYTAGTPYTRNENWLGEQGRLFTNYFPIRGDVVLSQFRTVGLYPAIEAPSFNQHGGRVARGFGLTMTGANAIYFTTNGVDPRVAWTNSISPLAQLYTNGMMVTINNSMVVKARCLSGTNWSALNEATFTVGDLGLPLRITEIMYNPTGGDAYEFVELQNEGSMTISLAGLYFEGITYVFPPDRHLLPGQVMVLANSLGVNTFSNRYPGVQVDGWFGGSLANSGESLIIKDQNNQIVVSVTYNNKGGWPAAANGLGSSLEINDPYGDPNSPANWRASGGINGTPGLISAPPAPGTVQLNEIMADNVSAVAHGGTYPDWVELHNAGSQPVDLTGWGLSNDGNPFKFIFPASTILSNGAFLVVWCDSPTNPAPGLHSGFTLGRKGENLFLVDAAGTRVDAVSFGLQIPDYSLGRAGNTWNLNVPTPNAENQPASLANPTNLVINEWLANALPGGDDWIELYNRSAIAPVALQGLYLGTSNAISQFSAPSFIPAGGYVQFLADENPGANHLNFKLAKEGGVIVLFDPAGVELTRVTYGLQVQGVSQGLLPDGGASITSFTASPTPGTTNYVAVYSGPVLNEVLAVNRHTATNAAFHTAGWIELRNPATTNFSLAGMKLSRDVTQTNDWAFPAGTIIQANAHLLVWCDAALPASTIAGPSLNTGFSLDGQGGAVYLLNSSGQVLDSVAYGVQAPDWSIGLSGGQWRLLATPTPGATNAGAATLGPVTGLCVNEWLANPSAGDDWFEIFNTNTLPVALGGLYLTDDPSVSGLTQFQVAPLSFIGGGGLVKWIADAKPSAGPNHVNFSLDPEGEAILICSTNLGAIDTIYYGPQAAGGSQGRLPDGTTNFVSFPAPTPAEPNFLLLPNIVINEVLTHTDPPLEDAIEFLNLSGSQVNVGGWYVSDSQDDLKKFQIQGPATMEPNGFLVLYENQFNGAGVVHPFALSSAYGSEVWLSQADASGKLTGYRAKAVVGPAANGVSFGRFQTSQRVDFVPLSQHTFGHDTPANLADFRNGSGQANAYPLMNPVVINEIMYGPPRYALTEDPAAYEYLELLNNSTNDLALYDPAHPTNTWRLRNAVSFDFPGGVVLPARSYLLVVGFHPTLDVAAATAFRTRYSLSTNVALFGPWQGKLNNAGDRIELLRPDNPQGPGLDEGYVPYLLVEAIDYGNTPPWPIAADGGGSSLQRFWPSKYGNDPVNWRALSPTPAGANVPGFSGADADHDGLPDAWEDLHGFSKNDPSDADLDADQDGFSNYDEFLLGTNPRDAGNHLVAPLLTIAPTNLFVEIGQPAVFYVEAAQTGAATYQWFVNDAPILGAVSAQLVLTNSASADAGQYRAVIFNLLGSVSTAPVHVSLVAPPSSLSLVSGTSTNLIVFVAGPGTYSYQWAVNGTNIPGATTSSLSISNAQTIDEGAYSVTVTDGSSVYRSPDAVLQVLYKVSFTQQLTPQSQILVTGDNAQLSVGANGTLPITYILRRLGTAYYTNLLYSNFCTFTLTNVKASEGVFWDVTITNAAGVFSNSSRAYLTVVTNLPASRAMSPGSNVVLTVGVFGVQTPRYYQWRFNDTLLDAKTNLTLSLTNFAAANEGRYTIEIRTTNASYVTPPAWLTMAFPPGLSQSRITSNGDFALALDGNLGVKYSLEASTNLTNWSSVGTIVITNRPTEASIPDTGLPSRFFRVRLLQ